MRHRHCEPLVPRPAPAHRGSGRPRRGRGAVDIVFPSLAGRGAPFNISGAGLAANAPNRDNALAFLAFLLTEHGQRQFAELTNEFPVVEGVTYDNDVLAAYPQITPDPVNVNRLGENATAAQRIFDRVGWP